MHLLYIGDNGAFSLAEFYGKQIPSYAILSHTWIASHEEVTFKDITKGRGQRKAGYGKLNFIAKQATADNLRYFWVDTCCIDKASSAELQEAINSMFLWYQKSSKCYVYLADVTSGTPSNIAHDRMVSSHQSWKPAFLQSRWFTRGWTLQELLAPRTVQFFSSEGNLLGDKISLWSDIEKVTEIPLDVLQGDYAYLLRYPLEKRLSWAAERETTREEDAAYSLLGLFNLHIPLLYGEGRRKAFSRLHRERES
ncbi:heterokaryon incompatibility protein-domain-containing protein, partial [Phaeosphaeria sp. MPI-PUGE-AT-0046c]